MMSKYLSAILIFLTVFSACAAQAEDIINPEYAKAKVLKADTFEHGALAESKIQEITQSVTLKVLSGKFKGKVITIDHMASSMMGGQMLLRSGDKVVLFVEENPSEAESPDGSPLFSVADYAAFLAGLFLCPSSGCDRGSEGGKISDKFDHNYRLDPFCPFPVHSLGI
jgi:uncharacterized membrane protein